MVTEELEFAISQYADGTLPAAERAALELRLEGDREARAVLEEYRRLDAALKTELPAVPELNWDRLAAHLSDVVADEAERPLAMPWVRRLAPLAVAASLIVGVGIAAILLLKGGDGTEPTIVVQGTDPVAPAPAPVTIVQIAGTEVAPATGETSVAQVEIGPSPQFAAREGHFRAAEAVVSRPSRVIWIASGAERAQDGRLLPY